MSNVVKFRSLLALPAVLGLVACFDGAAPEEPVIEHAAGDSAAGESAEVKRPVAGPSALEEAPVAPSSLPTTAGGPVKGGSKIGEAALCAAGAQCRGSAIEPMLSTENWVGSGRKTRGSNSQQAIPQNLTLADVDADGIADFVQTSQNRLFVSKTDFEKTGILHLYQRVPIKRVITGDFSGGGYDQTCLIQTDNALACFGISTDRKELWWWFTQGSFIADNEDSIVGDFTGDGRDDILVYPRGGGAYRMYSINGSYFFAATPSFAPGNLNTATSGLQLRAGDFNGDGRDDLAVVNGAGQFLSYTSVWDGTRHTFWWGFTTNVLVGANDQVTVARIDDDNNDDIVLRNRTTGSTRFHRFQYSGGNLPAITNPGLGQISTTGNSQIFFAALRGPISETGGIRREDALVYEHGWNGFVRSDARWSGSAFTYYWAYSQYAPNNHAGWMAPVAKPWLFLKCKFSDIATTPQVNSFYQNLMFATWGLSHFWHDASYGAWDTYGSTVRDPWYTMSINNANWRLLPSRWDRANACINAYGGSTAGFVETIALVNGEGDAGNQGRVLMTPDSSNSTFLAHEVGHTFGYGHSWDDSGRQAADWSGPGEYYDHWDVMSAMNVYGFDSGASGSAGPGLNAPYQHKMSFVPAHRRLQLNPTATAQSTRLNVAAIGKPEANGPLYVRIGANNNDHYTVEYRMKSGFDQGIPRSTVLVHRVTNGRSILLTGGGPERMPVTTSWFWIDGKWVSVVINGFATAGYTADVTINY